MFNKSKRYVFPDEKLAYLSEATRKVSFGEYECRQARIETEESGFGAFRAVHALSPAEGWRGVRGRPRSPGVGRPCRQWPQSRTAGQRSRSPCPPSAAGAPAAGRAAARRRPFVTWTARWSTPHSTGRRLSSGGRGAGSHGANMSSWRRLLVHWPAGLGHLAPRRLALPASSSSCSRLCMARSAGQRGSPSACRSRNKERAPQVRVQCCQSATAAGPYARTLHTYIYVHMYVCRLICVYV